MLEEEKKLLKDCGFANVMQLVLAYVGLQYEIETLKQDNQLLKIQVSSREEVANKYIKAVNDIKEYIDKNSTGNLKVNFGTGILKIIDKIEENK